MGQIAAGDGAAARHDSRREHDRIETAQRCGVGDAPVQVDANPESRQLVGEVTDRFAEVALSRNAPRHAKLAAELAVGLEELDAVAERRESAGALHSGGAAADDGKAAALIRGDRRLGKLSARAPRAG